MLLGTVTISVISRGLYMGSSKVKRSFLAVLSSCRVEARDKDSIG